MPWRVLRRLNRETINVEKYRQELRQSFGNSSLSCATEKLKAWCGADLAKLGCNWENKKSFTRDTIQGKHFAKGTKQTEAKKLPRSEHCLYRTDDIWLVSEWYVLSLVTAFVPHCFNW